MQRLLHIILTVLLLVSLTACGEKSAIAKRKRQAQCPEVYVLNHTQEYAIKAPGFERTDNHLYQVKFVQLSNVCNVKKKNTRLKFDLLLEMQADSASATRYPPFAVFVTFLDNEKKPLWREKIIFEPQTWTRLEKLKIRNKVIINYPSNETPPAYVYFGFVKDKETLQQAYKANGEKNISNQ